jgi:hypothetical protein
MSFMKGKGILQPIDSYVPNSMESCEKFEKEIKVEEKSCFVGKWAGELGQLVCVIKLIIFTIFMISQIYHYLQYFSY